MKNGYYKKPIEDIIYDVVKAMDFTVTIYKAVQNGNLWTLNVDDVYHAAVGSQSIVTIGGNPYTITGITYNIDKGVDQLIVQDNSTGHPITATSFSMYSPFYFYGTLVETGTELSTDNSQCTPMVFLRLDDTLNETFHADPENSHERTTNCEIYCFTQNDFSQQTDDLLINGVDPMRRLFENFMEQLKATIGTFEQWDFDYKLKYYSKAYIKSADKQLWTNQLSGVGTSLPLKILRPQYC